MTNIAEGATASAARAVLGATRAVLEVALADPRWNGLRAALPEEAAAPRPVPPPPRALPQPLPVTRWLERIEHRATPTTRALCRELSQAAAHLSWGQTYSADDFGPAFLERYGWTELIGQRGPYASDSTACGFLLLGPDIAYPRHRHEAEEVYVVLSGTAAWQKADGPVAPQAPGTVIHHPPWCWHAMRTGEEPLLALYLWRGGNLTQKSEIGAPA